MSRIDISLLSASRSFRAPWRGDLGGDEEAESLDCDRRDRGDKVDSNDGRNRSFPRDEEPTSLPEVFEKTLPSSETSTFA
jgi:hypothetical protein